MPDLQQRLYELVWAKVKDRFEVGKPWKPADDDDLHTWIQRVTKHAIPRRSVCPEHDAPFAFLADFYFERATDGIVLANRAGGKTESLAALHLANGRFKPDFTTTHLGAIDPQARRCYSYYRAGLRTDALRHMAPRPRIRSTVWENGSAIEILPGTEAQTQGPHTPLDPLAVHAEPLTAQQHPQSAIAKAPPLRCQGAEPAPIAPACRFRPAGSVRQIAECQSACRRDARCSPTAPLPQVRTGVDAGA